MYALSVDAAKNYAAVAVVLLLVAAVAGAWLMDTLLQKLLTFGALVLLAFAVWTQRGALQECADKVDALYDVTGGADSRAADAVDDECKFFGITVTVPAPTTSTSSST